MHFSGFDFEGLALDLYFVSKVLDEMECWPITDSLSHTTYVETNKCKAQHFKLPLKYV